MERFVGTKNRTIGSLIDELKKIPRDKTVSSVSWYGHQFLLVEKKGTQPTLVPLTEDEEREATNV